MPPAIIRWLGALLTDGIQGQARGAPMTDEDEDEAWPRGRQIRFTLGRIDKLMREVEHLQQQTDVLLDRCRYLHGQLRIAGAVAGVALLMAIGLDWWFAIGLPVASAIFDAIITARGERKADKIFEKWRALPEDFDDYAEAERRLKEELAEIDARSVNLY
jgi:hypothetical protein